MVAAAVLAAIGLDCLLEAPAARQRPRWLAVGVGLLAALAAIYLLWYRGQVAWEFWERPLLTFLVLLLLSTLLLLLRQRRWLPVNWFGGLRCHPGVAGFVVSRARLQHAFPRFRTVRLTETAEFLQMLPKRPK